MSDVYLDCWGVLQLDEEADERSIKRQYARLLKVHRPDEDAEAFQRLREAYEQAMGIARWRSEADEDERAPVVAPALASPSEPSTPPVEPAAPSEAGASTLLDQLGIDNLAARWRQALEQHCDQAFEQGLALRCLMASPASATWLAWGLGERQWLTPFQRIQLNDGQQRALVQAAFAQCRGILQGHLQAGDERPFLAELQRWAAQPWLSAFDRRLDLQAMVLELFHQHSHWSAALFDRVCQLFGWDVRQGVIPQPAGVFHALIARSEEQAWWQRLRALAEAENPEHRSDRLAARLLLTPLSRRQQIAMTRTFILADWQACHDLASQFVHQYPRLLGQLPHEDAFFWQPLMPRPFDEKDLAKLWSGAFVVSMLHLLAGRSSVGDWGTQVFASLFISLLLIAVARWGMNFWAWTADRWLGADVWLTERLVPAAFNRDGQALLMRHGLPWLALAGYVWLNLGVLGLATMLAIGIRERLKAPTPDQAVDWLKPWRVLSAVFGWDRVQTVIAWAMIAVIVAAQLLHPVYPLTKGLRP